MKLAKDNLSELTEGRKLLYVFLVGMTFFSFFSVGDIVTDFNTGFDTVINYVKPFFGGESVQMSATDMMKF